MLCWCHRNTSLSRVVALTEQKTVNAVHGGRVTPGVQRGQTHNILRPVLILPVAQSDLIRQAVRLHPPEGLQVGVEEVYPGQRDLEEDTFMLPVVDLDDRWSEAQWMDALATTIFAAKKGRKTGPDAVPIEFMRAGSAAYIANLARVARATAWSPIPTSWRIGTMIPVPRKAGVPMGAGNVRGVLAGSHPGKAIAKVARHQVAPFLKAEAGQDQFGAVSNGGTEFPELLNY